MTDLDRCIYKKCREPVEVISQGRPLCYIHYAKEIEKELKRFLKEGCE